MRFFAECCLYRKNILAACPILTWYFTRLPRLFKTSLISADFGVFAPMSRAGFRDFTDFYAHYPISNPLDAVSSDRYRWHCPPSRWFGGLRTSPRPKIVKKSFFSNGNFWKKGTNWKKAAIQLRKSPRKPINTGFLEAEIKVLNSRKLCTRPLGGVRMKSCGDLDRPRGYGVAV